ncbi:hypothetical protein [Maribacter sp.]|uniref:O-antigen ligase family protein n=1 Tax=Maribacter sp. TaxID=1897614 RepID=UPI0025BE7FB6|nr:hypothetical protein [Maribacter sp.]
MKLLDLKNIKLIGVLKFILITLYFINPLGYGYAFGYMIILVLLFNKNYIKKYADRNLLILIIFSVIFALFYALDPVSGIQFIFIYAFFPACFYVIGKHISSISLSSESRVSILLFFGIAYASPALVSVGFDIITNGFVHAQRNIPMIWGGERVAATNMAAHFVLTMCFPGILIIKSSSIKLKTRIILLAIFIISVLCVLRLGSRTQISILIFTFAFSILYKISKQSIQKNIFAFITVAVLMLFAFQFVNDEIGDKLFSAFADRAGSKKYGASSAGGRTERWMLSLESLITKPLGWSVDDFGYSHNFWLDVARMGGILTLFFLLLFSFRSFWQIAKIVVQKSTNYLLNGLILNYGLALFLLFFVEPILNGYFMSFIFFCFMVGMVNINEFRSKQ